MNRIYCFLLFALVYSVTEAQDYFHFETRDKVEMSRRYGDTFLSIRFKNQRSEKVYVSFEQIIWKYGETVIDKNNGAGITLAPGESSSFGMIFTVPDGYDSKLRFELENFRVEIGGQGKDPRYQKAIVKTNTANNQVTDLNFDNNTYKTEGSNDWKPMPKSNEITFPNTEKNNDRSTSPVPTKNNVHSNGSATNHVTYQSPNVINTDRTQDNAERILQQNLDYLNQQNQQVKATYESISKGLNALSDALQKSIASEHLKSIEMRREEQLSTLRQAVANGHYELTTCSNCNGQGIVGHKPCDGTGRRKCGYCAANGKTISGAVCAVCHGEGSTSCNRGCEGTGISICSACSGAGMLISQIQVSKSVVSDQDYVEPRDQSLFDVGESIEKFEATTITGSTFSMSEYSSKSVLIVFWSSTNRASVNEYKYHCANLAKYKENNVLLVGIAAESSRYQWTQTINEDKLEGLNISDLAGREGNFFKKFQIKQIPMSILIEKGLIQLKQPTIRLPLN